jgi:hypothetical protein
MHKIALGCEPVETQLIRWTQAVCSRRFEDLEGILAPDFRYTCDISMGGDVKNRSEFIAFTRSVPNWTIEITAMTAFPLGNFIGTLVNAKVEVDLEMAVLRNSKAVNGAPIHLAYVSAWRKTEQEIWQCFNHHIFGVCG